MDIVHRILHRIPTVRGLQVRMRKLCLLGSDAIHENICTAIYVKGYVEEGTRGLRGSVLGSRNVDCQL